MGQQADLEGAQWSSNSAESRQGTTGYTASGWPTSCQEQLFSSGGQELLLTEPQYPDLLQRTTSLSDPKEMVYPGSRAY